MKKIIKNFLIWLNTPRCIDIPVFSESKDAELYDELRLQANRLAERKAMLLQKAEDYVYSTALLQEGYILSPQEARFRAELMVEDSKARGFIDNLNNIVKPSEVK